jgi:DNA ligase (NAD+)
LSEEIEIKDSPFKQKKVCITGSLSRKRSEIEKDLRELGAIVVSSVSKNTHYLLTNDKTPSSSKFKKAMALDIPVISEEEFYSHKDL